MAGNFRLEQNGAGDLSTQVPIESVEVVDAGPGGVSTMSFTIDDIAKGVTVSKYDDFRWIRQTGTDTTIFRGYAVGKRTRHLGIGRQIEVECVGLDVLLDWLVGTGETIAAATNFPAAIAQIASAKTTTWDTSITASDRGGNATDPIGSFETAGGIDIPVLTGGVDWAVPKGTTRQRIEALNLMSARDPTGTPVSFGVLFTVDPYFRFRAFEDDIAVQPADWSTLQVNNTTGADTRTENLEVETDWRTVHDRVRVIGTSELWVGSTSLPRHEALYENADLNTANERQMAGEAYLLAHGVEDRGSFTISDHDPNLQSHAGGLLALTDTITGATGTYRISEITRRFFNDARETWDVVYGRRRASAMRQIGAVVVSR